jgi:hypothetical protein
MQSVPSPDGLHQFLDIATPLALGAVSWVGWMLRAKVSEVQRKTENAASDMKEELINHNTKVATDLAVHQAEDKGEFRAIRTSQQDIKNTLVRMEENSRKRRRTDDV